MPQGGLGYRNETAGTGLYYLRQRWYDPGLGKFLSQDPIGFAGGWNLHNYPTNPLSLVDPEGWKESVIGQGVLSNADLNIDYKIIYESNNGTVFAKIRPRNPYQTKIKLDARLIKIKTAPGSFTTKTVCKDKTQVEVGSGIETNDVEGYSNIKPYFVPPGYQGGAQWPITNPPIKIGKGGGAVDLQLDIGIDKFFVDKPDGGFIEHGGTHRGIRATYYFDKFGKYTTCTVKRDYKEGAK